MKTYIWNRMMDRLYPHINELKDKVAKNTLSLFNQEVDVLFFDVTTLYFESFPEFAFKEQGKVYKLLKNLLFFYFLVKQKDILHFKKTRLISTDKAL